MQYVGFSLLCCKKITYHHLDHDFVGDIKFLFFLEIHGCGVCGSSARGLLEAVAEASLLFIDCIQKIMLS